MQIDDGAGTGNAVKVDSENRLHVDALIKTMESQTNHKEGKAYSVLFSATPVGPGDCFFYMKNLDEIDMVVEGIGLFTTAAEYIDIRIGDEGTPSGGSNTEPVNLNSGSGNTASGTFQDGNDITGLSGGDVAYRYDRLANVGQKYENFEQDIILPKNGVLTMYVETGTTFLRGFLDFYYKNAT